LAVSIERQPTLVNAKAQETCSFGPLREKDANRWLSYSERDLYNLLSAQEQRNYRETETSWIAATDCYDWIASDR
jgi:hypothetical protein